MAAKTKTSKARKFDDTKWNELPSSKMLLRLAILAYEGKAVQMPATREEAKTLIASLTA